MNSIIRVFVVLVAQAASVMAASAGMPLLGRTSQPIGHYEFCKRYPDQCGPNAPAALVPLTEASFATIERVNRAINEAIAPLSDSDNFGVPEFWTYPKTEGDCEDYALLKQYMLERAGFPRSSLLLTVLRQRNGDGHAVLTVTTDKGDFVLDNLEAQVKNWVDTDYLYLKRQSDTNSAQWIAINDQRDTPVASIRR